MAVFRIEKTRDYTVMSNHHLRDTDLSLKSKGLLSMMLSLPEDWNYRKMRLRGEFLANVCAYASAVCALLKRRLFSSSSANVTGAKPLTSAPAFSAWSICASSGQ